MTQFLQYLFWISIITVFYTYIGYGILLYLLVKIKEKLHPEQPLTLPVPLPDVTLLIAAYNEEKIIKSKMDNCATLDYPKDKLHVIWVTDGSTDSTNMLLATYPNVTVLFSPERRGKTAALNRAMPYIKTSYTIFTDANTMLNTESIKEIMTCFTEPKTGCVAGEKRIENKDKDNAASGGEGFYWRYESKLKAWDSKLYSTVGAAGELFAIRTELFTPMPEDTLLDDFILSLRIAMQSYKITYCDKAYAIESGSADMHEEQKRKVRIAAGGLQSIARLKELLNLFKYGTLTFQYISHRVLRWSVTPVLLFLLFPLNLILVMTQGTSLYKIIFILQVIFYVLAWLGAIMAKKQIKIKILFIPYYFTFMNLNVLKAFFYLKRHKGKGTWEKANRG